MKCLSCVVTYRSYKLLNTVLFLWPTLYFSCFIQQENKLYPVGAAVNDLLTDESSKCQTVFHSYHLTSFILHKQVLQTITEIQIQTGKQKTKTNWNGVLEEHKPCQQFWSNRPTCIHLTEPTKRHYHVQELSHCWYGRAILSYATSHHWTIL